MRIVCHLIKVSPNENMMRRCFASYMSMHWSAIFPRCTAPQSRDEAIPVGGRVPLCLHLCIMPLAMCPGTHSLPSGCCPGRGSKCPGRHSTLANAPARVPLWTQTMHLRIMPCAGFWIGDIIGSCTMVSVPPMCTQAFFWNLVRYV